MESKAQYTKPQLHKVALRSEEAVLTACKTSNGGGSGHARNACDGSTARGDTVCKANGS